MICTMNIHRYTALIKFQADAHTITVLPTKDPLKKVHHAYFMVIDEYVDAIINLWLEEWCGPLVESLLEGHNADEPSLHQVNGEENEGNENQDDPSQEHNEDDDNIYESYHHASECPPSQEHAQTQMHA